VSAFQLTTIIGVPLVVLFVTVVLLAFARPDRDEDNGPYAAYLALASVFSLYLGLLALAATGEAVGQYLAVGNAGPGDLVGPNTFRTYFSLMSDGGPAAIAAFATLTVLMAAVFAYHARRRSELTEAADASPVIGRVDRSYRAGVCFAMLSLVGIGAVVAGSAGYDFFAEPVGASDAVRDLAMGSLLAYGGLILVAGGVFRTNVWAIRGRDAADDDGEPKVADVADVR
jgi:hypothetical protein